MAMKNRNTTAESPAEYLAHWSQMQREFVKTRAAEEHRRSVTTPLIFKNGVTLAAVLNTFLSDHRDDDETSFALNLPHTGTHSECAQALAARLGLMVGYQPLTTEQGDEIVQSSKSRS